MCQTLHNQMPFTRTLLSDDEAGNRKGLRYYSEDIFANSAEDEGQGVQELVSSLISDLSEQDSRHFDDFPIKSDSSKGCVGESIVESSSNDKTVDVLKLVHSFVNKGSSRGST